MENMVLTEEMQQAYNLIENTTQCLFITGKAGTGKTTFLRYLTRTTQKKYVITASTGIAAINAGGSTLHSLFGIPLGIQDPNGMMKGKMYQDKLELFNSLDMLIIDEISMVRPDTIDYIDRKLRLYRNADVPFGGVQVVMFGDLYQLPPVVKDDEANILLMMYRGPYFFYAHVFRKEGFRIIELNHIFRQHDQRFVEILNNIRTYKMTVDDIDDLDEIRDKKASENYDGDYIHICAYRKQAENINLKMLGEPTHIFSAALTDGFAPSAAPCDMDLKLRPGARVMMLCNDANHLYCNGSMGYVTNINDEEITVALDNGCTARVNKYRWSNTEYKMENDKIVAEEKGTCTQFPITLAWAITIHKSQGLTFDKVVIHARGTFAPGQLYVALSRCTSMSGIISDAFIDRRYIIPDKELMAFDKACRESGYIFNGDTYRKMRLK